MSPSKTATPPAETDVEAVLTEAEARFEGAEVDRHAARRAALAKAQADAAETARIAQEAAAEAAARTAQLAAELDADRLEQAARAAAEQAARDVEAQIIRDEFLARQVALETDLRALAADTAALAHRWARWDQTRREVLDARHHVPRRQSEITGHPHGPVEPGPEAEVLLYTFRSRRWPDRLMEAAGALMSAPGNSRGFVPPGWTPEG